VKPLIIPFAQVANEFLKSSKRLRVKIKYLDFFYLEVFCHSSQEDCGCPQCCGGATLEKLWI